MHTLVFILVSSTTKDIKSEVERLLAGSDYEPEKQFQQYKTPCSCVGSKALFESYRILEATPEGSNLLMRLREARVKDDQTSEEEVLVQRFTAARTIAKGHAAYQQPDPECEICGGSGISLYSRDPRKQWDYWSIGGRWSGLFASLQSGISDDEELNHNTARASDIPNDILPAAIVTPEGDWYTGPIVMEDELFESHREEEELRPRKDWQQDARALLFDYSEHLAVVVDCHS